MANKKAMSGIAIFFIIVIVLILGFIAFKLATPNGLAIQGILEPKLSVSGVSFQPHFGLSQGCSTTVSGYVSNTGSANAQNVRVICELIGSGKNNAGEKTLGSIAVGSNSYFSFDIDNDCPEPNNVNCYT